MAPRKKVTTIKPAEEKPTYHVEYCTFTNSTAPANEHTRDAIVAIARALEANANALGETARALKGGNAVMDAGLKIN